MIGLIIKQLMSKENIDVSTLSKRLGKTKQAVYDMLEKTDVNTSVLRELSNIFNVPISRFFYEEDLKFNSSAANTTGDFSPAVSGVQGDATVTISNEGEALQKERIAHLNEKVKHLQDIIDEKERLIKVLLDSRK